MSALRAKLRSALIKQKGEDAERREREAERKERKLANRRPWIGMNLYAVNKREQEEGAVHAFLTALLDVPDDFVLETMKQFASDPKAGWGRKRFFTDIIDTLPGTYYKNFAAAFISQDLKNSKDFFDAYKKRQDVALAIHIKRNNADLEFQGRVGPSPGGTQGEATGSDGPSEDPHEAESPPADEEGWSGSEADFEDVRGRCAPPWERTRRVYITPAEGGDIGPYIWREGETRREGGTTWHPANERFLALIRAGGPLTQDGDVLSVPAQGGQTVGVKVAYDTGYSFTVRGEALHREEMERLAKSRLARKTRLVEFRDGKPVTVPAEGRSRPKAEFANVAPLGDRRTPSWVRERVKRIYISPAGDSDISPYVWHEGGTREERGTTWYPANERFLDLIRNGDPLTQDGDVLSVPTQTGQTMSVKVAYDMNRGLVIRDEALHREEMEHLAESRLTRTGKVAKIMAGPVTTRMKNEGISSLSAALHEAVVGTGNDNRDATAFGGVYQCDADYVSGVIELMAASSGDAVEFATRLAEVVVFLRPPLRSANVKVFAGRLHAGYYSPEALSDLAYDEKLPEVFDDPAVTEEQRAKVMHVIQREIDVFVDEFGDLILRSRSPTERTPTRPRPPHSTIRAPRPREWKSACVNKGDVKDVPDAQVIYYEEDGATYCLTIPEIAEQIVNGETPRNPYTGRPLSEAFVDEFWETYSIDLGGSDYGDDGLQGSPAPGPPPPPIAPGLLNLIREGVAEREREVLGYDLGEHYGEPPAPTLEDLFGTMSLSSDEETDMEWSDSSPRGGAPAGGERPPPGDDGYHPGIVNGNVCQNCRKKIPDPSALKTKVDSGGGFETVHFCSFRCFEDYNIWPRGDEDGAHH